MLESISQTAYQRVKSPAEDEGKSMKLGEAISFDTPADYYNVKRVVNHLFGAKKQQTQRVKTSSF